MKQAQRIKKRRVFQLATHNGKKFVTTCAVVQVVPSEQSETYRVGFTTTKRLGNAVVRNRIRRRLRAGADLVAPQWALNGFDYVLIGRKSALDAPYENLIKDIRYAFKSFKKYIAEKENRSALQENEAQPVAK